MRRAARPIVRDALASRTLIGRANKSPSPGVFALWVCSWAFPRPMGALRRRGSLFADVLLIGKPLRIPAFAGTSFSEKHSKERTTMSKASMLSNAWLDEAATRSKLPLTRHDLFCTFTPSILLR